MGLSMYEDNMKHVPDWPIQINVRGLRLDRTCRVGMVTIENLSKLKRNCFLAEPLTQLCKRIPLNIARKLKQHLECEAGPDNLPLYLLC